MSFQWPIMLVALAIVPLLAMLYVRLARTRTARRAELAAKGLVQTAAAAKISKRRHVPFILFLAALSLLALGLARPQMDIGIPRREGTVILAFDVSNSMVADDLKPSRMDAAKAAATAFVRKQPSSIQIGVVAFSDSGLVTQQPSFDQEEVIAAVNRLKPSGGTMLGQGMLTSLNTIVGKPIDLGQGDLKDNLDTIKIGFYGNASIVLLSDGQSTGGIDPLDMADLASVAGVKVHTIGIGTTEGAVVQVDGFSQAVALDEETMAAIAEKTGGSYSSAADTEGLSKVYDQIQLKFTRKGVPTEVTGLVAGIGALLMLLGVGFSMAWFGRVM